MVVTYVIDRNGTTNISGLVLFDEVRVTKLTTRVEKLDSLRRSTKFWDGSKRRRYFGRY